MIKRLIIINSYITQSSQYIYVSLSWLKRQARSSSAFAVSAPPSIYSRTLRRLTNERQTEKDPNGLPSINDVLYKAGTCHYKRPWSHVAAATVWKKKIRTKSNYVGCAVYTGTCALKEYTFRPMIKRGGGNGFLSSLFLYNTQFQRKASPSSVLCLTVGLVTKNIKRRESRGYNSEMFQRIQRKRLWRVSNVIVPRHWNCQVNRIVSTAHLDDDKKKRKKKRCGLCLW